MDGLRGFMDGLRKCYGVTFSHIFLWTGSENILVKLLIFLVNLGYGKLWTKMSNFEHLLYFSIIGSNLGS